MDIMFVQGTIDSLRTLTRQNGALTQQNSQLINEVAKEDTLNSAKEAILDAVNNAKPEINLSGVAQESTLQEIKNTLGVVDDKTFVAMTEEEITNELTNIWGTMI